MADDPEKLIVLEDVLLYCALLVLGGGASHEAKSLSWFNPSQQLSTTQPLPPPPSQWGEEEERKEKCKTRGLR